MHTKSDSEVTSIPGSSPPRSPRHSLLLRPPAYYVQSPSRDSHDGDSKLSFQSTPLLSPVGSPLHPLATSASDAHSSSSSLPPARTKHHHSRVAAARIQPQPPINATSSSSATTSPSCSKHISSMNDSYHKKLLPSTIFEEEDEYGSTPTKSGMATQIYTFLFVVLSCVVFLFLFILFFWLICRPSRPVLSIKNIVFHNLYVGQGTDASGVPSMLLTVNSTVQIDFENRSRYFGAHLDPLSVDFLYSELTIASKQMDGYVQGKSTRKVIPIVVEAMKVPLYGASSISSTKQPSVPVTALVTLCSRYYIVGQMVKSRFCSSIACDLAVSSSSMALLTPIKSACIYDPPLM